MRRAAVLAASALLAFAAVTADAATPRFPYGVAAGEVTPTSAILWTRAPKAGVVGLAVGVGDKVVRTLAGRATPADDLTVRFVVRGLQPRTAYSYLFVQGNSVSPLGTFETAPTPTAAVNVRFAISGDADATPGADGKPGFNRFQTYARMAAERNDFNINLGDTIYSDSGVAGAPPALKLAAKWAMYRQGLALPALRKLRAAAGLYSHWDDHEFVNDFTLAEHGRAVYEAGVKAFTDFAPVSYSKREGLYRTFRWGKHVELFFLDERSFRSAKASAGGVCGKPADLAPTAPAAVRGAFASLAPSLAENGEAVYRAGVKAFRDYAPVAYSPSLGLYRSVRWGKNLELFFLDERSFRSAKADDVCGGDLAPTAPQAVRDAFASLSPSLKNPVPAECLAAINDPARTMLGARQYAAFTKAISASKATWKVIVNEVPIQQYYALPYDRWEGYAAERERLLRFLQANVRNVVFLTTDTHANFVNEVRYSTLGGVPEGSGIWEVVTGPVATNTFAKEIDGFLGTPGAGTAIGALFFKPPPPNGMGMRCAALDTYSYSQVMVTARTLTVAMKDAKGRPVQEATGVECEPLVLTAR